MATPIKPIEFFVPGIPKAQPKHLGQARVYEAGTAEAWKGAVALAAKPHLPKTPLTGPLMVSLIFCMPRPKSHYRTGKYSGEVKPDAPDWHTCKPDRDNLEKAVLDVLTRIGMWKDDGQVCDGSVTKIYGFPPGLLITIRMTRSSAPVTCRMDSGY
ncbi:MAG: RusA family crossover junction endodeoxyribonuclease [Rhodopirellula sp.]|nr:RusA family crossover junction endodeoxyribonuclease [Rhodopirellula sp.]